MAAICAGCRGSIARGEKFRIVETQVFHERCVSLVSKSVLAQKIDAANRLRVELAHERSDAAEARIRTQSLERELALERERNRTLERDRDNWRDMVGARNDALTQLGQQRDRMKRERDQAIESGNAARQELALQQMLSRSAPPAVPASQTPEEKPTDDRNPTEVRFSLIEPHET